MAQIAPLYARITNPRTTDNGQGSLPSVRDLYKGLSLSSQFKVSLFLNRNSRNADNLDGHLTRCGIFDEYSASSYSYDFFASEAILPGANFDMTEQPGSYQGMLEYAPTRRIWPDFEVSYYIDKNYNLLRLFEEWMNYINPLYSNAGKYIGGSNAQVGFVEHNSYYRMKYPGKYKRTIAITKFERDFWKNPNEMQAGQIAQQMISYQLIDAFPKQVTAVPVTYDGSTVTKVTVIFGYTRYITHKGNGNKTSAHGSTTNTGKNRNYRVNRYLPPSIDFEYAETSGDVEDDDIDLSQEIESDSNYADENADFNDYYTDRQSRLDIERNASQFDYHNVIGTVRNGNSQKQIDINNAVKEAKRKMPYGGAF